MPISTYLANKLLNHVLLNTSYTSPGTSVYVGLYTAAPNAGGGGSEVSGGSYARVQNDGTSDWTTPASGSTNNSVAINFPTATGNWGTVNSFGIFDASSSGNLLFWSFLVSSPYLFTGLSSTSINTAPGSAFSNGDTVIVEGNALPTGYTADTIYYVVSASSDTFKLSATSGGSAITITGDGAGNVFPVAPKTVNSGDSASFAISALVVNFTLADAIS